MSRRFSSGSQSSRSDARSSWSSRQRRPRGRSGCLGTKTEDESDVLEPLVLPQEEAAVSLRYYRLLPTRHSLLPHRDPSLLLLGQPNDPSNDGRDADPRPCKDGAVAAWQRCVGLYLIVTLMGKSPVYPSRKVGVNRSVGTSQALELRTAQIRGKNFKTCIELLQRLLQLRSSPLSLAWSRKHYKIATYNLVVAVGADADRGGSRRHAELAASVFSECLGPDPSPGGRLPIYPHSKCLLALARGGLLTCQDFRHGSEILINHLRKLLTAHRPHDVDLALIRHFEVDLNEVELEVKALAKASLSWLSGQGHQGKPVMEKRLLLSLLKFKPPEWWKLPSTVFDSFEKYLSSSRDGQAISSEFAAWRAPEVLSQEDIVQALATPSSPSRSSRKKLDPPTVLAGLKHWQVSLRMLEGGTQAALHYVRGLLKKPRSHFAAAVGIAAHFDLTSWSEAMVAFESDALTALAFLAKADRRALDAAVAALLAEPSLIKPPADWVAAAEALLSGATGPIQWPSWAQRRGRNGSLPTLALSVPRHFVATSAELRASVKALTAVTRVGLDAEWSQGSQSAALLQLATASEVFLWDLCALSSEDVARGLDDVLGSENVLKLGFGFRTSDWPKLAKWASLASNLVDLDLLWARLRPLETVPGLRGLVQQVLGKKLDKTHQCSDWEARPLTDSQLDYAALDAHCLLQVWDVLKPRSADVDAVRTTLERRLLTSAPGSLLEEVGHGLDLRVGQVRECWPIPKTRHLKGCRIDLGALGVRQLVQGCQITTEQRVVVLCNIVPRELHGLLSQGGLLVAYYEDDRSVAVSPPKDAPIGSHVDVTEGPPPQTPPTNVDLEEGDNAWETAKGFFSTDEAGQVLYKARPLSVGSEPCFVHSSSPAAAAAPLAGAVFR